MTSRSAFANPPADDAPLSPAELEQLIALQGHLLEATVGNEFADTLLTELCLFAEQLVDETVATIMLLGDDNKLHVETAPSIDQPVIDELDGLPPGEGSCGNAVLHNEEILVCDTLIDPRWNNLLDFAKSHHIGACWSYPIHDSNKRPIGSFALSSFRKRTPDNFQRRLLRNCAAIASLILQKQRSEQYQRRQHAHLNESQYRYRTLLENSTDGITLINAQGRFIDANPAAYEMLGYSREEYLNLGVDDVETAPAPVTFETFIDGLPLNESLIVEGRLRRKDGSVFPAELRLRKFLSHRQPMMISSFTDITQRQHDQDELLRASKMESISVLAGGIAHDFNNLLGIIMGHIDLAERFIDTDNRAGGYLAKARKASMRAADLTQQLLTFSRGGMPVRKIQDLRSIVFEAIEFCMHGSAIDTRFECNCEQHYAFVDKGQLSQVIQNLAINARQAMADSGCLQIVADNVELQPTDTPKGLAPGHYIRIRISDTGPGIPETIRSRIFEPYFTTKEQGSGLGLAMCYSIIRNHDGHIAVSDNSPHGTTFTLLLPVASNQEAADALAAKQHEKPSQPARVLLMDDDEMIREVAQAMLENIGCSVVQAENGEQAIDLYRQAIEQSEPFDLVIMDLTIINGMGGQEAMQHIRQIDADALGIVSSGYSNDDVMANCQHYGFAEAVSKPYLQDELEQAVSRLLSLKTNGGAGR